MWDIGTAGVNAYILYKNMYDADAKKKQRQPQKKWTHCECLVELVYDLIWPARTKQLVEQLKTDAVGADVGQCPTASTRYGQSKKSKGSNHGLSGFTLGLRGPDQ